MDATHFGHQTTRGDLVLARRFTVTTLIILLALFSVQAVSGEWIAHLGHISVVMAKIDSKNQELKKLLEVKRKAQTEQELHTALDELSKGHRELLKLHVEFQELKNHARYSHPEQGNNSLRKYTTYRTDVLDEVEAEVGIDGKLNRFKEKIDEVYSPPKKPRPMETKSAADSRSGQVNKPVGPSVTPKISSSIWAPTPTPERIKLVK